VVSSEKEAELESVWKHARAELKVELAMEKWANLPVWKRELELELELKLDLGGTQALAVVSSTL
jgi:hypothetical protein